MQMSWISPTFQWCGEFLSSAAFFPLQMSIGGKRYKQDHFLGHNYVWSLTECLPRWWRPTRPTSPGWTPSYGARSCARTRSSSNWWARTRSSWGPGKYHLSLDMMKLTSDWPGSGRTLNSPLSGRLSRWETSSNFKNLFSALNIIFLTKYTPLYPGAPDPHRCPGLCPL